MCICEVDVETGHVRITRYLVSEDCGVMINPAIVEGQLCGGIAQGIGGALYEELLYDDGGFPLVSSLLDYKIPTAVELPEIEFDHVESVGPSLSGSKGVGESGAIGSPACVLNAISDALSPWGIVLNCAPVPPDVLSKLLRERQSPQSLGDGRRARSDVVRT
jgi:carbon-monoxide dehydrogenase large subunit